MDAREVGEVALATPRGDREPRAVFKALDKDGNGKLTPSELSLRLSDFGLDDSLIETLFYRLDTNHDGEISIDEFVSGYHEYLAILTSQGSFGISASTAHRLVASMTSLTAEALPAAASLVGHKGGTVKIHTATYEANAPSEDRSTVVVGDDFVFCGVWDGHGQPFVAPPATPGLLRAHCAPLRRKPLPASSLSCGLCASADGCKHELVCTLCVHDGRRHGGVACSEYVESQAFGLFAEARAKGQIHQAAWESMYSELDKGYLEHCNQYPTDQVAKALFAGACCTGCFVDLRSGQACPADQHELLIHSAANLSKTGWGKSDPYCLVTVNGTPVGRTPTRSRTQDPEWQASIQLRGLKEVGENVVRVVIMDHATFTSDDEEGVVEFRGEGLSAFAGCVDRLAPYPVSLNGEPAGELTCQLQTPVRVGCGNLGDSRAVLGVYESGELRTVPLSADHSAASESERALVQAAHPDDPKAVMNGNTKGRPNWRVKGVCAFSRSIGDCEMKDPAAAALYNSKKKVKVLPRPGVVRPKASAGAEPVAPYISAMPEYKAEYFCDGFVICGCDGVWDEMSSAEAVQVVSELLAKAKAEGDPAANIADQFIEIVMNKVLSRLRATYKAEKSLTIDELKARPSGKKVFEKVASVGTKWCKSCLHDDITVVILDFTSAAGGTAKTDVAATLSADAAPASILAARQAFAALDTSGDGQLTAADVVAAGQAMGQPLSMEQADGFLAAADLDGSGSVFSDEFATWLEANARAETLARQGGEDGAPVDVIGVVFGGEDEDDEQADAGDGGRSPGGGRMGERTGSDRDVFEIFRAVSSATPALLQQAATAAGLAADALITKAQLADLLTHLPEGQEIDGQAAALGAEVVWEELSDGGTYSGFTLAELAEFIERSV